MIPRRPEAAKAGRTPAGLLAVLLILLSSETARAYTLPDDVRLSLNLKEVYVAFRWITSAPAFNDNEAVEFEIWFDPKCYARPRGGKDNLLDLAWTNRPTVFRTDVWNYWWPTWKDAKLELLTACSPLSPWFYVSPTEDKAIGLYWDYWKGDRSDARGNIAIYARNAKGTIKRNQLYEMRYPLEPGSCADSRETRVYLGMQVHPDTCYVPWFYPLTSVTCPHLLGYDQCSGISGKLHYWQWADRICGPTDIVSIPAVTDGKERYGDKTPLPYSCVDKDSDTWYDPRTSTALYGSRLKDCDDFDRSVYPGAKELCSDTKDNDCNGSADCADKVCLSDPFCKPTHLSPAPRDGSVGHELTRARARQLAERPSFVVQYTHGLTGDKSRSAIASPSFAPHNARVRRPGDTVRSRSVPPELAVHA